MPSGHLAARRSEHVDDELRIYFYNAITSQSSWSHPLDSTFREVHPRGVVSVRGILAGKWTA